MDRTTAVLLAVVAVCSLTAVKGQMIADIHPAGCRVLQCDAGLYCEFGHVHDGAGCPICECQLPQGPSSRLPIPLSGPMCRPTCQIFCRFGNVIDAFGCPTCSCNPGRIQNPVVRCPRGSVRIRPRLTCSGFNQCPVNAFCASSQWSGQFAFGLRGQGRLGGQGQIGGLIGGQGPWGGQGSIGGQGTWGGQGPIGGQGPWGGRGPIGGQGPWGGQGSWGGQGPWGGQGQGPLGPGQWGGQSQGICCRRRRAGVCRRVNWQRQCFQYWDQCSTDFDCGRASRCCPGPCGRVCQRRIRRVRRGPVVIGSG